MKKTCFLYLVCVVFIGFFSCSEESKEPTILTANQLDTISFEPSLKGWELYSMPNGADWDFSLMVGTNTLKSYEKVIDNDLVFTGMDGLKSVLGKMPEGEEIIWMSENWLSKIWITPINDLMLPSENIVQEIDDFCENNGLTLMIAN